MPATYTYPGVYIEEVPSTVRTIVGVATSITAFIGRTLRGPADKPVRIQSTAEFERRFGPLWTESMVSYAVTHFFLNGGADAIVVRVAKDAKRATFPPEKTGNLQLEAAHEGSWGDSLRVRVDYETREKEAGEGENTLFNLSVKDMGTGATEVFRNVSVEANHRRNVERVLRLTSELIRVVPDSVIPAERPPAHTVVTAGEDPFAREVDTGYFEAAKGDGSDGDAITDTEVVGNRANRTGLYALESEDIFNLLVIPPLTRDTDVDSSTWTTALAYCKERRAMLLVDPTRDWLNVSSVPSWVDPLRDPNAAIYFPRVKMADPLKENRLEEFAPGGLVAGVMARTDVTRGVWKAPAGQDATLVGVRELTRKLTDPENGQLNPLGVNCLRLFPVIGPVVWGTRTLRGADRLASEWKYIPVRRLALYMEESLYRGTQWVVFEPNDEPLWAQIRLNVGAFMHDLFRKGAFQGSSPREAYFVKCDKETTTQNDINLGIVNILVGFAPLKPAEFVVIKIQQMAGNVLT
ncbi:MAG: phage tail sheath family protein [Phycisphaerae bacterium]|nr:phage tail sheath family protein [Phycisphaerae bacterium]